MAPRAAAGLMATLSLLCPDSLLCQDGADPVLLRYKTQAQPLHYEVTIATEFTTVAATGSTGRWDGTHSIYEDVVLEVQRAEGGTLSGRYDLGTVRRWDREARLTRGGTPHLTSRPDRITRFEMNGTGDVGVMGDRIKALSGEEIFRRLWQVPHLLPEEPVEVGSTWSTDRSLTMSYSHSTRLEAEYKVVEVIGEDVWVEFSGEVLEFLSQSRSGQAREGNFTGRFGFRPSLGAMVAVEWEYDYRTGNPDRPWEYIETREEGSIVLKGLAGELPVQGVTRVIPENRNNKKALLLLGGLLAIAATLVLGAGTS